MAQNLPIPLSNLKEQALNEARSEVRSLLSGAQSFHTMELAEQKAMYADLVKSKYQDRFAHLAQEHGLATEMKKASDDIDDKRHQNSRIDEVGAIAGDFIDDIDFPGFVTELLKGVFQANLDVTIQQMESYTRLMKAATASIAKFVNIIDNTAAFGYLAENNSDEFSFDFPADDGKGSKEPVLTDKNGNKLDLGNNEVKAKIMDAKIAMAKEQRALLRETILMGISRLVVEKGVVKAAVVFDIKAKEQIQKTDRAAHKDVETSGGSLGGGISVPFVGRIGGGSSSSKKEASISVSSAKSTASTDLAAKITGSVEIQFKSDYFKLDNFATMYGPQQQDTQTQQQQQLPAAQK